MPAKRAEMRENGLKHDELAVAHVRGMLEQNGSRGGH